MIVGMGLIKNEHGVWCARVRVEKYLQAAGARVLGKRGKASQTFLKQSLRIKKAEALIAPEPLLPLRTTLSTHEIERLAQEMHVKLLGDDERHRFDGRKLHAGSPVGRQRSGARRG